MPNQLVDELTFGEWWLTSAETLHAELENATPSEREFITRTLIAFTSLDQFCTLPQMSELQAALSCWLDDSGDTPPRPTIDRLAAGEDVPPETWHRPNDRQDTPVVAAAAKIGLTLLEVDELTDAVAVAAEITGRDLHALGTRLSSKWCLAGGQAEDSVARIADALGVTVPTVTADVPPVARWYVDQAMFVPAPRECGSVVFISPSYRSLSATDPFAASRLLLTAAHEITGHAADFHDFISTRPTSRTRWLDRELLEGWGIIAETRLSTLGADEHALHLLYKAKRLLPLAHQTLKNRRWERVRTTIEASWPGFFHTPETTVLRRATGTHARGLLRVQRALRTAGTTCRRGNAHPWQTKSLVDPPAPSGPVP